jgi:hypothetical protein
MDGENEKCLQEIKDEKPPGKHIRNIKNCVTKIVCEDAVGFK